MDKRRLTSKPNGVDDKLDIVLSGFTALLSFALAAFLGGEVGL